MQALKHLLIVLACMMTLLSAGHAAPGSAHATYNIMRNGLHVGVISERYEAAGGNYSIVSNTTPVGLLALSQRNHVSVVSRGDLTPAGLQPLQFDARRGKDEARRVTADFDWKTLNLKMHFDGRTEETALPRGAQDRLSALYQFMHIPPAPKAKQVEFAMTNGRKLDHYRYSITPEVTIDTPYRRLTTIHLVKQREPNEPATEIWLSPEHHFLPVKVLIIEEDGVRYEQLLTRLEVKP